MQGFSLFLRVVSSDYGKPRIGFPISSYLIHFAYLGSFSLDFSTFYIPWESGYLWSESNFGANLYHNFPRALKTMKNKGFGHLKTRLFTIKTSNSNNVGFGGPRYLHPQNFNKLDPLKNDVIGRLFQLSQRRDVHHFSGFSAVLQPLSGVSTTVIFQGVCWLSSQKNCPGKNGRKCTGGDALHRDDQYWCPLVTVRKCWSVDLLNHMKQKSRHVETTRQTTQIYPDVSLEFAQAMHDSYHVTVFYLLRSLRHILIIYTLLIP